MPHFDTETSCTDHHTAYSTGFKYIEKIIATAPQPHQTVLKHFAIFKDAAHRLKPGETPSNFVPGYIKKR